jgi:hypothetical protein
MSHLHALHEQVSPWQSEQAQASWLLALAAVCFVATQQAWLTRKLGTTEAVVAQPQLPHSQTPQVQTLPLQSGHLQSTHPQDEFPLGDAPFEPAAPTAKVRGIVIAAKTTGTKKRFMIDLQTEND